MQVQRILSNVIEYAIEFTWQMGDDEKISRAKRRHQIWEEVETFIRENEHIPQDDVDEYIFMWLKLRTQK